MIRPPVNSAEPIALEDPSAAIPTESDPRPKIEIPPPVRILAVDDCLILAPAGLEQQLDEFYSTLLGFERIGSDSGAHEIVYRAENFRLRIEVIERPRPREDFRALALVIPSLRELITRLSEAQVVFERQRGLIPGADILLLFDPAGNTVSVGEYRIAI